MTPVSGAGSAMFVAENISCGLTKYYKVSEFTLSQEPLQSLVNLFFWDISTDSSGSRNQENDFSCMKIFWRKWPQTRTPNKCQESSVTSHPLIKLGHTFSQHPCPVSGTTWNHLSSPDSPRAYWTAGRLGPSTQCHVPLHVKLFASWKVLRDPSKQVLRCVERSVPQKAPRFFSLRGAFCSAYFFESVTRSFFLYVDVRVNCLEGDYVAWNVLLSHLLESRPWWMSSIDYDVIWRHKRLIFTIRLSIHDNMWMTFASRTSSLYQKKGDFYLPRHITSWYVIDDVNMKVWCSVQCWRHVAL